MGVSLNQNILWRPKQMEYFLIPGLSFIRRKRLSSQGNETKK
uniref:Uncharacterized protein n=1 Tax=Marseillevirus sp. TaxID=2809551 RepID=A0AA96ERW7_9VIRU|nr:hypothetical protein MarFTMF_386 [Marseillevirus sp.]